MYKFASDSLAQLSRYFANNLEELNIPELVRIDTNSSNTLMNGLMFNADSNLKKIYFKNLEQSPYIMEGNKLEEVNLEKLLQVEVDGTIGDIYSYLPPAVLRNTKIQTLNLPNFKGSSSPTSQTTGGNIDNTVAINSTSFWNNYWLSEVSLGNSLMNATENGSYKFNGFWFKNSYFLHSLKLNYPYVIPMIGRGGFATTPIGTNPNDGYIYVPDNLLSSYQLADGWTEYSTKIRPLTVYQPQADTITDSWETIIDNCAGGNVSKYQIGQTKTVKINGIPTQFVLVGKGIDPLYESISGYNAINGNANLSWLENTITRFEKVNISQSFTGTKPSYDKNIVLREKLTSIYNAFETTVKNGIKTVKKYSRGYDDEGELSSSILTTNPQYIWLPSATELNLRTPSTNTFVYSYFNTDDRPSPSNYYLGATKINTINSEKIKVALRDYSGEANAPDCLIPSSIEGDPMEISVNGGTSSYLIIGFCT